MYIADLHIHSRYSRATSKECTPEHLDLWARRKGIQIVGTGDFTHPAWREELAEKLTPAEDGLYVLKEDYRIKDESVRGEMIPRFVITGEISSIYTFCRDLSMQSALQINWSRSATSILTGGRSSEWTAMTFWRSRWNCVLLRYMFLRISGRHIFRCLAHFRDSIQWKSVLRI